MESISEIFQPGLRFWDEQRRFEKERLVVAEVPGSNPHQTHVDIDRRVVYMPAAENTAGVAGLGAEHLGDVEEQ